MRFLHRFFVLMAVLLVAVSAFAQITASLTGTVTLEGNPVPGVTVTISSPAMQGTRTTNTDVNGNYNFGGIPPGEYTVKFEMESMQTVTKQARVGVSQTGRADAALKLSAVAESITVTASAPAVLESVEIQANVPQKLVDDLPIGRRVQDAVLLTPGVNNNGPNAGTSITISGAPAYDSLFMVNGAVINENLRGQAHNLFIEDAVQETTVLTGAISAEYGRFTGGVVNAITKSGGNEFHGSLRDSLTNDKWTSLNSKYYDVTGNDPTERIDKINPVYEGTFGGRIIRDRLWFFAAGRYAKLNSGRTLQLSPGAGSDTNNANFTFTDENKRWEGKLTGQITPNHTLVASYLDIKNPQTNNCFIACYEFINLDLQRELPNSFESFHYNGILTNSLLLEANYSKKKFAFVGSGGDFTDLSNGTAWYDTNTGYFFGAPVFCGAAECEPETRNNDLWTAKATYYLASKGFGTHNLVLGAENWKETRFSNNHQSGSDYFLNVHTSPKCNSGVCHPIFAEGDYIQWSGLPSGSKGSDFQTRSAFLNDKWDFNQHFSFNLGVRYDKNNGKDAGGADVARDSAFSPRLGLIYDITGNGRYRINASYSKYVSKIAETVGGSGSGAGNPVTVYYRYEGPTINANGTLTSPQVAAEVFKWFAANGGLNSTTIPIDFARVPGLNQIIGDDLKSPDVTEYTIGFGSQLTTNSFVRVDAVHRDWGNFYAVFRDTTIPNRIVTDEFGNRYDLGFVENADAFERKYNGVTVQASYRPWERLNIGGNYTWSQLKGNVTAETGGSGPVSEAVFSYPEFRAFPENNPSGYLNPDQRHKVRAWVSYDLPTPIGRWNFSALERYDSGTAYSAVGNISSRFSASVCATCPNNATLGYATQPSQVPYYFSDRGAFRWDDVTSTDLGINYELPIGRISLFGQADIINIFNEQAQTLGDVTVFTPRNDPSLLSGGPAIFTRFDPFANHNPTQCPVHLDPSDNGTWAACTGYNYALSTTFGQPTAATGGSNTNGSYQLPRTYRVSFGVRF